MNNSKTETDSRDESNFFTVQTLPYEATPYPLYKKVRHLPLPVLLASGNDRSRKDSRFEFITAHPDKVLRTTGTSTRVECPGQESTELEGNPLDILAKEFALETNAPHNDDLPFTGGAIGYLGYEMLHPCLRIKPDHQRDIDMPDMLIGIYSWVIIIDHQKKQSSLIFRHNCPETKQEQIQKVITGEDTSNSGKFSMAGNFVSNFSPDEYQLAYKKVIDYILAGDCYQVNLTQRFTAPCAGDPYSAFVRLQTIAKAPFAAFMEDDNCAVLSFSPERFLQVKNSEVMTQPIKGTRPRNADSRIDLENRTALENSLKDRAENLMIVDLLRNDLGRICSTGSVAVTDLFETQSFTNVHHLVSTIKGKLDDPGDVFALLKASFPGGSITGTPKIRAMEIINELESVMRSVYCGAFAWIDFSGNMDSNICIRTLVKEDDQIHCWGGGGVVADSVGEQEYQESLDKINLFMDALKSDF